MRPLTDKALSKRLTEVMCAAHEDARVTMTHWTRQQIHQRWPDGRYEPGLLRRANLRSAYEGLAFWQL